MYILKYNDILRRLPNKKKPITTDNLSTNSKCFKTVADNMNKLRILRRFFILLTVCIYFLSI